MTPRWCAWWTASATRARSSRRSGIVSASRARARRAARRARAPSRSTGADPFRFLGARRVHLGDARVLQSAEQLGLVAEAGRERATQRPRPQQLHRHLAMGRVLLGLVNDAHASSAQDREDRNRPTRSRLGSSASRAANAGVSATPGSPSAGNHLLDHATQPRRRHRRPRSSEHAAPARSSITSRKRSIALRCSWTRSTAPGHRQRRSSQAVARCGSPAAHGLPAVVERDRPRRPSAGWCRDAEHEGIGSEARPGPDAARARVRCRSTARSPELGRIGFSSSPWRDRRRTRARAVSA